jgi:hypothetical protein
VLYHLQYPADTVASRHWPDLVVAKTYRGKKGRNAFDGMLALWNSPLGSSEAVQIAEPLAYNEEQRVMIQGPIREEQTLKRFMIAAFQSQAPAAIESLDRLMRKTAVGLAELHHSGVQIGDRWDLAHEMSEVQERVRRLDAASPGLLDAARPLLDRVNQLAAVIPPGALVPSHGSFRPAQVLLHRDEIGFIDFDSFCQSEPANDLALFLASLMSLGLTSSDFDDARDGGSPMDKGTRRARFDTVMSLSETFLEEYGKHCPVSAQRVALWETLDIFMLVLHGWIKVKPGELSDSLDLLHRFLRRQGLVGAP